MDFWMNGAVRLLGEPAPGDESGYRDAGEKCERRRDRYGHKGRRVGAPREGRPHQDDGGGDDDARKPALDAGALAAPRSRAREHNGEGRRPGQA